jgi:hypothetical protein
MKLCKADFNGRQLWAGIAELTTANPSITFANPFSFALSFCQQLPCQQLPCHSDDSSVCLIIDQSCYAVSPSFHPFILFLFAIIPPLLRK